MGPMQPQQGQPNAYAQMFNAHRGAQQPQGMPPMRPMNGPPPTGQAGPQQGMNPYAAMLQQARPYAGAGGAGAAGAAGAGGMPSAPGMPVGGMGGYGQAGPAPQRAGVPVAPGGPVGGMGQQPNPFMQQQRMQLAQQMAQQPRQQFQGAPVGQPQIQRPPGQMNPFAAR